MTKDFDREHVKVGDQGDQLSGPTREGDLSLETRGIESVPASERYGKPTRLFTCWFAPQITPVTFFIGALGPAFGLGFWPSFWVIVAANAVGAVPMGLLSTWGPRTGVPQLALSTIVFGRSVRLPATLNWLTTIGWQGFNNVFGATALNLLLDVPYWVGVILIFAGQITLSVLGHEAVHTFQKYMTWILGAVFAVLTVRILGGEGTTAGDTVVTGADYVGLLALLFVAAGSYTFSWSTYSSDYSRYLPVDSDRNKVFLYPYLGIAISATWMELLGLGVAQKILDGGVQGASEQVRDLMGGGFLGVVALVAIYLGIIGTNTLDDYTGSLSLQTAGIRIKRPITAVITGLLAFVVSVWFVYGDESLAEKAQNFLLFAGYWIAAWLGVVATDWLRRRGRVDVQGLESEELPSGLSAVVAMVVGFLVALPFTNTTIGYDFLLEHPDSPFRIFFGSISINHMHGIDLGIIVGMGVASAVYLLLVRLTDTPVYFADRSVGAGKR